jgi:Protein of unknown function (DUF4012)
VTVPSRDPQHNDPWRRNVNHDDARQARSAYGSQPFRSDRSHSSPIHPSQRHAYDDRRANEREYRRRNEYEDRHPYTDSREDERYNDEGYDSREYARYVDDDDSRKLHSVRDESEYYPAARGHSSDPWDRDWVEWSQEISAFRGNDSMELPRRGRSRYGGWPEEGTMASIAVRVAPGIHDARSGSKQGSKSKPNSKQGAKSDRTEPKAWDQIVRWAQSGFKKSTQPTQRVMRLVLVFTIVSTIVLSGLGMAVWAYGDYSTLLNEATSGVQNLQNITNDLGLSKGSPQTATITSDQLHAAQIDILTAKQKFEDANQRLASPDIILTIAGAVPIVKPKLESARLLTGLAVDACHALEQFLPALVSIAKLLKASPLADPTGQSNGNANEALLNAGDMQVIGKAIADATPSINQMISVVNSSSPDILAAALPGKYRDKILPILTYVPRIPDLLSLFNDFLPLAPTLLGMNGYPVAYLVTTLDSTEARPVGGFQGQYAMIEVNGGHVGRIALQDIYQYLEPSSCDICTDPLTFVNTQPYQQEQWWGQIGLGWALRNSGLSPDFPTSARYALTQLYNEPIYLNANASGKPYLQHGNHVPIVDEHGKITDFDKNPISMAGFITIQSNLIAQLMQLTGPINVGCPYNISVPADQLQLKIHYYQEVNAGRQIAGQAGSCPGSTVSGTVKAFTALLTQQLITQLKAMPTGTLLKAVELILHDFQTRDIQVYFTQPNADPSKQIVGPTYGGQSTNYANNFPPYQDATAFMNKYGINSATYTGKEDSLMFNLANVSGNKLDQFLQMKLTDTITFDTKGKATHSLVASHVFNVPKITVPAGASDAEKRDAVYSYIFNARDDGTYIEYWRVYAHPDAVFLHGNGINGPPVYPDGQPANYAAQYYPSNTPIGWGDDTDGQRSVFDGVYWYHWDPPTGSQPAKFYTIDKIDDISMTWRVTSSVINNGVYTLHVQRQSGINTSIDITIKPPACSSNQTPKHVAQTLDTDLTITMPVPGC